MINTNWDGDLTNLTDIRGLAFRGGDRRELNDWPRFLKVIMRAVGILTGKTNQEVRAALAQAFDEVP